MRAPTTVVFGYFLENSCKVVSSCLERVAEAEQDNDDNNASTFQGTFLIIIDLSGNYVTTTVTLFST